MAAVPVVNNLLAQRPFFMIKIHRQNLSTFIKILISNINTKKLRRILLPVILRSFFVKITISGSTSMI